MIDAVLPGLRRGRKVEPRREHLLTPQPVINTATIKPKAAIAAAQAAAAQKAAARSKEMAEADEAEGDEGDSDVRCQRRR